MPPACPLQPLRATAHPAGLLAALCLALPAQGQVIRDGSIGPGLQVQPLGPHYEIPADMGEQHGGNLFHSFQDFSLYTVGGVSESATFTPEGATAPIENVVSRVTGGRPSEIDGTLRSTIPEADFYFLNPAGLVFGPNAELDVQGSFHASTADRLKFDTGEVFETRAAGAVPLLTVASPVEFGFLDGNVGYIVVEPGGRLRVGGEALSLVGAGDVTIAGSLRSDSSSGDAGRVTVRGGAVSVPGFVSANGFGSTGSSGSVLIEATGEAGSSGSGGSIEIHNGGLVVGDGLGARIVLRTGSDGAISILSSPGSPASGVRANGGEGTITIEARTVEVVGTGVSGLRSSIDANTPTGQAGSVTVVADEVHLRDGGWIAALGFDGDGGQVTLDVSGLVEISSSPEGAAESFVGADGFNGGDGGLVELEAGSLEVSGVAGNGSGSFIAASGFDGGDAGTITIDAGRASLVDLNGSGIAAQGNCSEGACSGLPLGDGGDITIRADALTLRDSVIGTDSFGLGRRAGTLSLELGSLDLLALAQISSSGFTAAAGEVNVVASKYVRLSNPGGDPFELGPLIESVLRGGQIHAFAPTGIFSAVAFSGDAGDISIRAPVVELTDGAVISAISTGVANGGNIVITADEAVQVLRGGAIDSSALVRGEGGSISIEAGESVEVSGGGVGDLPSRIRAATLGDGDAGSIEIVAPAVLVDGGVITSATGAKQGSAGAVAVLADRIGVQGGGQIDSGSFGPGAGGTVTLVGHSEDPDDALQEAERIEIVGEGSRVSARAGGSGAGGNVVLRARSIEIAEGGSVATESAFDVNEASDVFRDLVVGDRLPQPSELTGAAGDIRLESSGDVTLRGGSVTARAEGVGKGGDIAITGNQITLAEGGLIEARSNESDAGSIHLVGFDSIRIVDGTITTSAEDAGGGDITLRAPNIVKLTQSEITASVAAGEGGTVVIDPQLVLLQDSTITAKAAKEGGRGGRIVITADAVLATVGGEAVPPESVLDASAPGGPELSGTVEINAPDTDLAAKITKLPESYFDASSMIQPHCAARGDTSGSFTATGLAGIPASPDGFLSASTLHHREPQGPVVTAAVDGSGVATLTTGALPCGPSIVKRPPS